MESSVVVEFQRMETQQFFISHDINKLKDKEKIDKLNFVNSEILNSMFKSTRASMLLGHNFPRVIFAAIPSSNASQAIPTTESSISATTFTLNMLSNLNQFLDPGCSNYPF
ncbi:hypothetical protein M9H77_19925 [Catharanthus roseus]|uniref:Uncharacterized protein n=1 Tax=Catharanthus roseus TaxID=4058 RepID=A0ACC0AKQ1_CATRO|nr:hypothetical protein M9H77_19925 [Catharanthus roseus]